MSSFTLDLRHIDKAMLSLAGGKGANLGELTSMEGIHVPEGFCITTEGYKKATGHHGELNSLLNEVTYLKADERDSISKASIKIRTLIENIPIPKEIAEEIESNLIKHGEKQAYAIRSSATAEDLPTASFAGQQDTYLNITGKEAILKHISKCWASLFTERAITYRIQNGFSQHKVHLAIVVQKMVFPQASGILFTADPVTCSRKVVSIDAGFGLGEALVSGIVSADNYKVHNSKIIDKKIAAKRLAIYALKEGGTKEHEIPPQMQNRQVLTDEQILQLEYTGRKIEQHFSCPQDIEWCLADDTLYVVQSRPITTLYPIPEVNDNENHVYISVGHQQMMTDAMKPLGISLWQLTARRPMFKAGGRLFVDVAANLASPAGAKMLIEAMGQHDPLIKDAVASIVERGDFIPSLPPGPQSQNIPALSPQVPLENDPAIVIGLIKRNEASVEKLKQDIQSHTGAALFDFIAEDIGHLKNNLFDQQNLRALMSAIDASAWLNENMQKWLGEKNMADILSQSVLNNITSEMGLALLDVADSIRPYPEVIQYLQHTKEDNFLEGLLMINGGQEAAETISVYLSKYGMRCAGEIDITKPRWSEKPATLIPLILSNIRNFSPGEASRKFEQGRQEALKKEQELSGLLMQLPDGEQKVQETEQMISRLRNFAGYREYPKYSIISRYFVYKQALLKEAAQLVQSGIINEAEDIYYLTFDEFHDAVRTSTVDNSLINERKDEHKLFEKLSPPRVITSDGEIITGSYNRQHLPASAFAGLPVSSGIIEGRARVILNIEDADLENGDILVTTFTDPSWTPLFVSIKGLVTEVGGLMTHGAVIAREYGLPAVVGVENATQLIKNGQKIRVNGTDGYVELIENNSNQL